MKKYVLVLYMILIAPSLHAINAQTIEVSTGKDTYNYGDYLGIIISVSEITGDNAVLYIVDSAGKKSTAILIEVKNMTTAVTSPNPFDSVLFKEGKYKIELEYAGASSSTEFVLVDAGNVMMPFGSNVVVPQWSDGSISDYGLLKFLADKNVISLPEGTALNENTKIPSWYKQNASWWYEKKISDEEFVNGLAYLLSHKVIAL